MVRFHLPLHVSVASLLSVRKVSSLAFTELRNHPSLHPFPISTIRRSTRDTLYPTNLHMSTNSKGNKGKIKELFRADKVLSQRANLTRSQSFDYLQRRRVAMKDDEDKLIPVTGPKVKIPMDSILYMDGKPIPQLPPILVAFHKPKYVLSAMEEKHSEKLHLGNYLPNRLANIGMHPVGRLDYDTSGLLLFSREGELTQRLLHPKTSIEKEYVATCAGGVVDEESLRQMLRDGIETGEGIHVANLLTTNPLSIEESQMIKESYKADDLNPNDIEVPFTDVRITVQEGKYRMVRRMLANCGHPVIELRRERHGRIELRDLPAGEFRECDDVEIEWAKSLLKR